MERFKNSDEIVNFIREMNERKIVNLSSEPIYSVFKSNNLTCVVFRTRILHYCGYVEINEKLMKLSNSDYDNRIFKGISVHGGLTFLGNLSMTDDRVSNKVFVGFDTAHCDDLSIYGYVYMNNLASYETYRSFRWTVRETIKLSGQIYRLQKSLNLNK